MHVPAAAQANTDRSAPPRWQVRLLWQRLDADVKRRVRVRPGEDELEVVRSCSVHRLRGSGVWQQMRLRALFALTCCLGGRSGALCDLRRGDVIAEHQRPDGRCGPAIALRPGKTYAEREIHYKPIPEGLLHVIDVFAATTDRILRETPDYDEHGRVQRPEPPADLALFPKSLRDAGRAMSQPAFYVRLTGYAARPSSGRKGQAPLLPRRDGRGFSPHTLRGAAMQMIKQAARDYLPVHHPELQPDDIVEALVDHEVPGDRHGYLDKNTLRGRELLSGIATELAWRMLTTEQGARRVRDSERYRDRLCRRKVLEQEAQRLEAEISSVLSNQPRRKDLALQALLELRALDEQRDQLRTRLAALDQEIERLRHDPATQLAAPDDIADEDLVDRFEEIERALQGPPADGIRTLPPKEVRRPAWVTIPEAADLLDISYPQMARWVNGQHLPYPAGDPRNPWQPDAIPVDTSLGPRRRRIAVDRINPAYIRTHSQQHRLAELLARWPTGWSETHCSAPLETERPVISPARSDTDALRP